MRRFLLFVLYIFFSCKVEAQHIFSRDELDLKKPFGPYEQKNVIGLDDQEMIILLEEDNDRFRLVRYDKYFFSKWSVDIDYKKEGSFPQLFEVGSEIAIFRLWTQKGKVIAEASIYDIATGARIRQTRKTLVEDKIDVENVAVDFSDDKTRFVLYNFKSDDGTKELFEVYDLKTLELQKSCSLASSKTDNRTKSVFVDDDNGVFIVLADVKLFTLETYFFDDDYNEPLVLSANFSLKRPAENIPCAKVLQESPSTYFVITPAYIANELVGMNISSFNVVLKSVLFSNTYDFDAEFVRSAYVQSLITSENQKKKHIVTPRTLENFKLQEVIPDSEGGITCIYEYLEQQGAYHDPGKTVNLPLKWKQPEDVYNFGEDIMILNFSPTGSLDWKRVIQKTQYSHQNSLTLSYLADVFNDEIKIVMQENTKGSSIYSYTIDLINGGVVDVKSFIDKKMQINKNYSTWIDEKTLLLCVYPEGSRKRSLFLVEF